MIPIYWNERTQIKNLPELLAKHQKEGGSILEFQSVYSAIFFSQARPKFVWIPKGGNRHLCGLVQSMPTLLLGWWSLAGFFWTINALIKNLMGGVDVTTVFTSPPPLEGQQWDVAAVKTIVLQRKIQTWVFAGVLFALLALAIWFCVIPYIE